VIPVENNGGAVQERNAAFATTNWSVVLAAGQGSGAEGAQALEQLCRTYWYPLYAFVRRAGHAPADAEDLTQEFFARFLEKGYFGRGDPARGRFRSYLLACLKHFLSEQWRRARRLKREGGQTILSWDSRTAEERYRLEPEDPMTPENVYDRRWALTLLERALDRLGKEQAAAGKAEAFARLKNSLWGEGDATGYAELAARLGTTEGTIKVMVHRLRHRYREVLREEVAQTVASGESVDEELRHLIGVIRG